MDSNRQTLDIAPGRWVNERELAALLGLHPGTLRTWRWLDSRDGKRRGGLIYRRFGDAVRYFLPADLTDPTPRTTDDRAKAPGLAAEHLGRPKKPTVKPLQNPPLESSNRM